MQPPIALTIAGSDSGGGAGIQADLKAFAAHGVFGCVAVTVLTAQNTVGVQRMSMVAPAFVAEQLDAVLADMPVAAVKTGMLASAATVETVASYADRLPNLVVDPVLVGSAGERLFGDDVSEAYRSLFAHAAVITPNVLEASVLTGRNLSTMDEIAAAAAELGATGAGCVVVTGGRLADADAIDVVWSEGSVDLLRRPRIDTVNNHGTGCTFAAVTAARLACGDPVPQALRAAKSYVHAALDRSLGWRLGAGHGPVGWFDAVTASLGGSDGGDPVH
jgi:hydroxymethylpyrimidine/phosphomethylpyrimidine kinase